MKLRRLIRPEMIRMRLECGTVDLDPEVPRERAQRIVKERLMEEMAQLLTRSGRVGKQTKLALDLWNREKKATTALGKGIAMPHVRTRQAKELVGAVGLSPEGIDYGAPDDFPVHVVVAVVAPAHDDRVYLRFVKRIVEALGDEQFGLRERLLAAKTPDDVVHALAMLE